MTTKENSDLLFKDKQNNVTNNDQYNNFTLNKSHQNSSDAFSGRSKSVVTERRKVLDYVTKRMRRTAPPQKLSDFTNDSQTNKESHQWNKTTKDSSLNFANDISGKEDGLKKAKPLSASTLSLHIEAYENLNEANLCDGTKEDLIKNGLVKKGLNAKQLDFDSKAVIENPLEFSRQQEDGEAIPPEIAQFSASQQLLNPNLQTQQTLVQQSLPRNPGGVLQRHVIPNQMHQTNYQQPFPQHSGGPMSKRPRYTVLSAPGGRPGPSRPPLQQIPLYNQTRNSIRLMQPSRYPRPLNSLHPPSPSVLQPSSLPPSSPSVLQPSSLPPSSPSVLQPSSLPPSSPSVLQPSSLPPSSPSFLQPSSLPPSSPSFLQPSSLPPSSPFENAPTPKRTAPTTRRKKPSDEIIADGEGSSELLNKMQQQIHKLSSEVKEVRSENVSLRNSLSEFNTKLIEVQGTVAATNARLDALDQTIKNKRERTCTNVKFQSTNQLLGSRFDVPFERKNHTFEFKAYVQSDMLGKMIEEVAKLIAIRCFTDIISTLPEPFNWLGQYSCSSSSRGFKMIPSNMFEDMIHKLTSLTLPEGDHSALDQTIMSRVNYGFNDKTRRIRTGVRKNNVVFEYVEAVPEISGHDHVEEQHQNEFPQNYILPSSLSQSFQYIPPSNTRRRNFFDSPEEINFDDINTDSVAQILKQNPGVSDKEFQQIMITTYSIKENTSVAGLERLEVLFKAFIGDQYLVEKADITRQKRIWLSPFEVKETIICTRENCKKTVANMTKNCQCGSDRSERVFVTTASITPHLINILRKNENELFAERPPTEKRGDLTNFMPFTTDEDELVLELILNTDGVMPKSNSRKPFHPIMLMVKNLCGAKRSAIKNILLSGIIIGVKSPEELIWSFALTPLFAELQQLKTGFIYTRKNGTSVNVKAVVTDTVLDQIAAKMVFSLSSHMSYGFTCTVCETFPTREDNAQRWVLTSGTLRSSGNGIGLPVNDTAFSKIAPCSTYRLDGLHVLDEGLCKTLLYYMQNEYKPIMENIQVEVKRTLLKYGNNSLAYAKGLKSLNAHELRLFFAICIPLLATSESTNVKVQVALLFWHLCRLLYSKHLNTRMIQDLVPIFELLGSAFAVNFGSLFKTIKGHRFFAHGGQELQQHGTPADFSAAPFESANRLLKLSMTPYNTRGFDRSLLPRHILNTVAGYMMEEMVEKCGLPPSTYKELYESRTKPLMSQSHQYVGELLPLMEPQDLVYHSVYRSTLCFKFNPKTGTFAYCKINFNGSGDCVKVVIGVERDGEKYLLCKKLMVFNPLNYNTFSSNLKPIYDVLSKYQSLVFGIEKETEEYLLIPLKNVLAFLLLVEYQKKSLLFDVSERYNKT